MKQKAVHLVKSFFENRKKAAITSIVILTVVLVVLQLATSSKQVPQVITTQVERGTIVSSISASGQVLSSNITNINSRASGIVKKMFVSDDDFVAVGQKVAELELDEDGKQVQATAYAAYLSAKSSLASAETNYHSLQSQRFAVNQKFINDAVARNLETTDPTYIQENADWLAAEAKFTNNSTDISRAKAALTASYLSYEQTRSIITSPIAGKINSITIAEGMVLSTSANTQRVASLITEGTPLATLTISEIDVPNVSVGQKVTMTIDSITDKTYTGKVTSIDRLGTTSNNVTAYPVIVKFDTASEAILPKMALSAKLVIEAKNDVLMVPLSAIQTANNRSVVILIKNGQQQSIVVETGITSDTQTEILSGLNEGDEILTTTVSQSSQNAGTSPFSSFGSGGFGGGTRIFTR